jgi:hypothetical protein
MKSRSCNSKKILGCENHVRGVKKSRFARSCGFHANFYNSQQRPLFLGPESGHCTQV